MANDSILIVDDNAINLKLSMVLLKNEGYNVKTCMNGQEAIELLKTFHPRLILMDIQLPDINGLELTRRFKADPLLKDIIIIAVTAYAMKGDEEKALEAGCDAYVAKPISIEYLAALVKKHLQK